MDIASPLLLSSHEVRGPMVPPSYFPTSPLASPETLLFLQSTSWSNVFWNYLAIFHWIGLELIINLKHRICDANTPSKTQKRKSAVLRWGVCACRCRTVSNTPQAAGLSLLLSSCCSQFTAITQQHHTQQPIIRHLIPV